jgi:3-oxoacyl-[acyl-carrier protein] reductase
MLWNELDLRGRTALVTGASRGIGSAITEALLSEGMAVWAVARGRAGLEHLAERLSIYRDLLCIETCDVGKPSDITGLFEHMRTTLTSLFLLVNNAGIGLFGPAEKTASRDWDRSMEVNARGTFLCCREAFAWMKETGGGRIINISSVVGLKGYVDQAAYSASKHAIMGLTKVLAREGQPFGIRASSVCPGGVATDMLKEARPDLQQSLLIQPSDVARAVRYLASEPETCCTDMIQLRRSSSLPFD